MRLYFRFADIPHFFVTLCAMEKQIENLYIKTYGTAPTEIERLSAAGSNRTYFRMKRDGESIVGCVGTSAVENRTFVYMARHFEKLELPVPRVIAISDDQMCYLQEDLGAESLYELIAEGRKAGGKYSDAEVGLLKKTIALLPDIQFRGAQGFDFTKCYQCREMDEDSVRFDLNYFKYCYLKLVGVDFDEYALEADFKLLTSRLTAFNTNTFLYRDFQARNVMIRDGKPFFIDFQGGRKGAIFYDVASFLWQASSRFSSALRNELIDEYLFALQKYMPISRDEFVSNLKLFVLFRTLQVLGAYGYRGLWEKKQYFIDSIPAALTNLSELLNEGVCSDYPELQRVADVLCKVSSSDEREGIDSPLVVRVFSFSYKMGIPLDESGNGGGYVFDCRAPNNPGRYEPYKQLTGLDKPVIDFIEKDGELLRQLESMYRLVDFHVKRYIDRGFTSLMISCGCTGGQHRSVYSAQHIAEYIHSKYGVEVRLCHREQNISQVLKVVNR